MNVDQIFKAIEHGDDEHRRWLKDKLVELASSVSARNKIMDDYKFFRFQNNMPSDAASTLVLATAILESSQPLIVNRDRKDDGGAP